MDKTAIVQTVIGGITLLIVVSCVTLLAWHGTLDGQATVGIFTAVLASAGAVTAQHLGVRSGAKAAQGVDVPPVDSTDPSV